MNEQWSQTSGWIGSWSPGIGDPTFMGWFTVFAYAASAWLCFRARSKLLVTARHPGATVARNALKVWTILFWLLVALGINKQLDLQSAFTEIARQIALSGGWYEKRRLMQFVFVVLIAGAGILGSFTVYKVALRAGRYAQLGVAGFVLLMSFVVIRAASFHYIDRLIDLRPLGIRVNWVLELGGISIIAAAARLQSAISGMRTAYSRESIRPQSSARPNKDKPR